MFYALSLFQYLEVIYNANLNCKTVTLRYNVGMTDMSFEFETYKACYNYYFFTLRHDSGNVSCLSIVVRKALNVI